MESGSQTDKQRETSLNYNIDIHVRLSQLRRLSLILGTAFQTDTRETGRMRKAETMARPKRIHPMLGVARKYLSEHIPELQNVSPCLRSLDGPPGSPRYSVTVEECVAGVCPFDVSPEVASAGDCPVVDCELRHSIRLLLDRQGKVVEDMRNGIHWAK